MRKVVVPLVLLAVAFGAWLFNRQPASDGESIVTAPVVTAPSENRPVVQTESEAVASEVEVATRSPQIEARAADPVPATTPAVVLQMLDQRGLRALPTVRENEKAFVVEPRDPLWSHIREGEILGQLAQVSGARLSTVEVDCRTSMCRLQFTQNVANGSDEHRGVPSPFYAELLARLGYEQIIKPAMARDNAGTVSSLAYLPRQ